MPGNESIQILRGTRDIIKTKSDKYLLPGQLLYNYTNNYLTVGTNNQKPLCGAPITVPTLEGYFKDADSSGNITISNSVDADTTSYSIKPVKDSNRKYLKIHSDDDILISADNTKVNNNLSISTHYLLRPIYYTPSTDELHKNENYGILIKLCESAASKMITICITGNSYQGGVSPINSMYQFYDYDTSGIIACSAVNFGYLLGDMKVYRYSDGYTYAFIKPKGRWLTFNFEIISNYDLSISPSASVDKIPDSNRSNEIKITPKNVSFEDHNHDTRYVNVTGDTMTGGLTLSSASAAYNDNGLIFQSSTGKSRIGGNTSNNDLGFYAFGNLVLRPGCTEESASSYGLKMTTTDFSPTTNKSMSLGTSSYQYNNIYASNVYVTNSFEYSGIGDGTVDVSRVIWFNDNSVTGKPVKNDNFKYNPASQHLLIGTSNDASVQISGCTIQYNSSSKSISFNF